MVKGRERRDESQQTPWKSEFELWLFSLV